MLLFACYIAAYFVIGWLISLGAAYKVGCLESEVPWYPSKDWYYWCDRVTFWEGLATFGSVVFWPITVSVGGLIVLVSRHKYRKQPKKTLHQRLKELGYKHGCKLK